MNPFLKGFICGYSVAFSIVTVALAVWCAACYRRAETGSDHAEKPNEFDKNIEKPQQNARPPEPNIIPFRKRQKERPL